MKNILKSYVTLFLGVFVILSSAAVSFAEADLKKGERLYKQRCKTCHSLEENRKKTGPSLFEIVDKRVGSQEKYRYSKDFKAANERGLVWRKTELITYLEDPPKYMEKLLNIKRSSTRMRQKLASLKQRTDLVGYLSSIAKKKDERNLKTHSNLAKQNNKSTISLMSFNVENLFDATDDQENSGDNTYQPFSAKSNPAHIAGCNKIDNNYFRELCLKLDWSEEVYQKKLRAISETIVSFNNGEGPDIVIFQEIENIGVLKKILGHMPVKNPYKVMATFDTKNGRGIDVGLISKLPLYENSAPVAYPVIFDGELKDQCVVTRDILSITLKLPDASKLVVFGVHFPSQRNPEICRAEVFKVLNSLRLQLEESTLAIAAGDFNISCKNEQQAFLNNSTNKYWDIPPVIATGCQAPGSSFYFDRDAGDGGPSAQWSFLDMVLPSKNLSVNSEIGTNWFFDMGSFGTFIGTGEQVFRNNKGQVKPKKFSVEDGKGVSDHWPVVGRLVKRN